MRVNEQPPASIAACPCAPRPESVQPSLDEAERRESDFLLPFLPLHPIIIDKALRPSNFIAAR